MRFTPITRKLMVAAMVLPAWTALPAAAQDKEPADADIVARIGDDGVVTRREFERSLAAMGRGATMATVPHEQQLELLNNIVDIKLQYALAKKDGVKITDADVDADIKEKTQGMTPEQFAAQLKAVGITNDELRSLIREQMTVAEYRKNQAGKVEAVTDEDVAAEFEKLNEDGQFDRVDVSHILITVPEGSDEAAWAEAKKRIDAAHTRVTTGKEDFKAVQAEVSEDPGGGNYPDTPRGRMVPEFEERMFSLPVGEISEPFRTQFGWHFLTPTAKNSLSLEDLSDRLRAFITEQRINEFVMAQVADAKAKTDIEIRLNAPEETPAS